MRDGFEDFRRVRRLLDLGCGQLVDEHGLDWWEIMGLLLHGELELLILLQRLAKTVGSEDEVYISRPGIHASLLRAFTDYPRQGFSVASGAQKGGLAHYVRVSKKLSAPQIIDVFWDKYDSGYQFRGKFGRKPEPLRHPAVLLPTAYVNVSRTGIAYANTFSEENFLLVATRRSGWVDELPRNVAATWLSLYASLRDRSAENAEMDGRWRSLLRELGKRQSLKFCTGWVFWILFPSGSGTDSKSAMPGKMFSTPNRFRLCCARTTVILIRGFPCSWRRPADYRILPAITAPWMAATFQEELRRCDLGEGKNGRRLSGAKMRSAAGEGGNWCTCTARELECGGKIQAIVVSAIHPLYLGALRCYRGKARRILPGYFASVSRLGTGDKTKTSGEVASCGKQARTIRHGRSDPFLRTENVTLLVSGPLTEDLLAKAWFGITILSTVATECAVRGIPCFLCKWLESWPYGYVEQFIRFGVGIGLNHPEKSRGFQSTCGRVPAKRRCWGELLAPCKSGTIAGVISGIGQRLRGRGALSLDRTRRTNGVDLGTLSECEQMAAWPWGRGTSCAVSACHRPGEDSGGHSIFAMAEDTPSLRQRLRDQSIEAEHLVVHAGTAEDAEETRQLAHRTNADWIVVGWLSVWLSLSVFNQACRIQAAIHGRLCAR